MQIKRVEDNLTKHERETFVSLTNNFGIVILKSGQKQHKCCSGQRKIYLRRYETTRVCLLCPNTKETDIEAPI